MCNACGTYLYQTGMFIELDICSTENLLLFTPDTGGSTLFIGDKGELMGTLVKAGA